MIVHPVILCGGSGTRLWPLSRENYPKQFLPLMSEHSMLQETLERLDGMEIVAQPVMVCNEEHRFLVAEQLRQLGKTSSFIILEPVGRNTAPALTLAALALIDQGSSERADPVMLVMPADHVIRDVEEFQVAVKKGAELASEGCLVTFGIVPTSPNTGYGYIRMNETVESSWSDLRGEGFRYSTQGKDAQVASRNFAARRVTAFVEKPDQATAEAFLRSKEYMWNSGIFMMRASVWLEQLSYHRPDIAESCKLSYARGYKDSDYYRLDTEIFTACPSDSIDYAVMEKTAITPSSNGSSSPLSTICVVLPLDAGWSDVGSWSAVWKEGNQDDQGNVIQGDVYARSTRDSLIIGHHRLVAAVGLDEVVVVETADAVLVAHKNRVQDVKDLVLQLKAEGRAEQENHRRVHRPWGHYECVDAGAGFQVKRLTVNPGAALSLQMHHHRAEHWVVVKGTAKVIKGEEEFILIENQSTYVPVGAKHRLENPGTVPLEIIEVQTGDYLGEDDIVRFADRYNRHELSG